MRKITLLLLLGASFMTRAQSDFQKTDENYGGTIFTVQNIIFTINYSRTVNDIIIFGKYDFVDSELAVRSCCEDGKTKKDNVKVLARLFHFSVELGSDLILAEIKAAGYRPATLLELLTFDEVVGIPPQSSHEVVALGSLIKCSNNHFGVPFINNNYLGRSLDLAWYNGDWETSYYFLAIKNKMF
ncbi:MAG: hypothetical protein WCK37_03480 [Candidatus Falkowbacteria bacterium]